MVMANPAQILHRYFTEWNTPSPARSSRNVNPSTRPSLAKLRRASAHIDSIRDLVQDMKRAGSDVALWESAIDRWTSGLFLIKGGWDGAQMKSLKKEDLDLLFSLGQILEFRIPVLRPTAPSGVKWLMDQLEKELNTGEHNPYLEKYLRNLISHIRWCIDNFDDVGEFEFERAWTQLQATILLIDNDESTDGNPSRFRKFMEKWFNPFTLGALAGMTGNVGSHAMLALTTGSGS